MNTLDIIAICTIFLLFIIQVIRVFIFNRRLVRNNNLQITSSIIPIQSNNQLQVPQ